MIRKLLCLAAACALYLGCMSESDGGTEIPNELTGHEFIAGKGAAAGADIRLVPVQFVPGTTATGSTEKSILFTAKTDAKGRFAFKDVPAGQYNLIAEADNLHSFRDSLAITGKGQELSKDTLRAPSSLTGKVELEPQDDPRKAYVQVRGTTQFVNVDSLGYFTLTNLGAGQYEITVIGPKEYIPEHKTFFIGAGRKDTLKDPIRPYYQNIPVVSGLKVEQGEHGTMVLTWNKSRSKNVLRYLIYRDSAEAKLLSMDPVGKAKSTDTVFVDTIYGRIAKNGRYDFFDNKSHGVSYHVNILDQSGAIGPTFGFAEATSKSPSAIRSGKWSFVAEEVVPRFRKSALLNLRDTLWSLPLDSVLIFDSPQHFRYSTDGTNWKIVYWPPNLPAVILQATVWRDSIWAVTQGTFTPDTSGDTTRPWNLGTAALWNSRDGRNWQMVLDKLPFESRERFGFLPFKDSLWVVSGTTRNWPVPELDNWRTGNGRTWIRAQVNRDIHIDGSNVAVLNDKLYAVGGGYSLASGWQSNQTILVSANGAHWDSLPAPNGLLPRQSNTVSLHAGKLWVVAGIGSAPESTAAPTYLSDVWSMDEGGKWTLVDGMAPFGDRVEHSTVSFKGKLWLSGGRSKVGPESDLWSMEP